MKLHAGKVMAVAPRSLRGRPQAPPRTPPGHYISKYFLSKNRHFRTDFSSQCRSRHSEHQIPIATMPPRYPPVCKVCKKRLRMTGGRSNLTYGGLCKDTAKAKGCLSKHYHDNGKRLGARAGSLGCGQAKRRCGVRNGRFTPVKPE